MTVRAARAIAECRHIATMTEEPGRTTRRFLTEPTHAVHDYLRARMETMGMSVCVDAGGNLRGLWQPAGTGRRLVIGSHIDTVPNAGAFDGVLGVTLALEWVVIAQQLPAPIAIEIIAFSEEEGVRYGVPYLGSRAVAGRFDSALLALRDSDGVLMEDALRNFGLDPGKIGDARIKGDTVGFVEVHIEQGPVLESEDLRVAAVTSVAGQTRLMVNFHGHANHAGTTPMRLRRDALAAAAEWICSVEALAQCTDGLVATVGRIVVTPNVGNVVAGTASVSLDIRHARDAVRLEAVQRLLAGADAIAQKRGLSLTRTDHYEEPTVPMDERLTSLLIDAMKATGLPPRTMHSGAGHDAIVMASRMRTAMLFLRSPGGISHHPDENVREEDVEASLRVAEEFLRRLSDEIR